MIKYQGDFLDLIRPAISVLLVIATMFGFTVASADTVSVKVTPKVQTLALDNDWGYLEHRAETPKKLPKSAAWSSVSVPHTWNAKDTMDSVPGYRRDVSWYKKVLVPKKNRSGLRYIMHFEAANMESDVFVNGKRAGGYVGGYMEFEIDITKHLKFGKANTVLVRVTNEFNRHLIPSQKSDFFIHGGLIRDVWLKVRPQTYVARMHVATPKVSASRAETELRISGYAHGKKSETVTLQAKLLDPNGKTLEMKTASLETDKGEFETRIQFADVQNPILWSIETPNLHKAIVSVLDSKGKTLQTLTEVYGYRWFEMRPQKGFFVNGEQTLIRGTHLHEDHAGIGGALSDEQRFKDMKMIKEMGANFVRLAHYPQDPMIYKAANELGLVIWDELPWCRGGKGGTEWESNTERLLLDMIDQNYNHPSIAFWSLGNEIYWDPDFEGGGDIDKLNPYLSKLNDIAHTKDPTRITTIRKYYDGADLVDSFSPSIWAGWYGGAYEDYAKNLKKAHKKYPNFLHMEYGGSSHVGRHTETPISQSGIANGQKSASEAASQVGVRSVALASNWDENYMVDLFDWHLRVSETFPDFAGNAQWAFKDFGTPLRPENPIPFMNQKGLVTRDGTPKDVYYVFKSYWSDDPFCWIESHTWTHRQGPKEGRDVTVYCNTEEATLYLDGKSLGKKTKDFNVFPAGGLVWKVPFNNGSNTLKVEGFSDGKKVAEDKLSVHYLIGKHGKLNKILLSAKRLDNGNLLIEAEGVDKKGNRVLDYEEVVYFERMGPGEFVKHMGTPHGSDTIDMASGYAAIEFIPEGNKPTAIEIRGQNYKGTFLELDPAKIK